jgi:hypothetical protein
VYECIRHLVTGRPVEGRGDVTLRGRLEPIPVYAVQATAGVAA